jgi:hypothetical protein
MRLPKSIRRTFISSGPASNSCKQGNIKYLPVLPLNKRSKRIYLICLAILAVVLPVMLRALDRTPNIEKGTWIWDTSIVATRQQQILDFAQKHQVTTIYLYIDQDSVSQQAYRSFIESADRRRIKVEALAGDPSWTLRANQDRIRQFIAWVNNYNAAAEPNQRFQGLHFDIEPYLLDEWETNNRLVLNNWMQSLRFAAKQAKGTGLKLTLDVPFWIHKLTVPDTGEPFGSWLLSQFDCLVLMDYRNFALGDDGIVRNAEAIVQEATSLGKEAIVAVDTGKSKESKRTTFYSLSLSAMEEQLKLADRQLSRYSGYKGIAVHDYANWLKLSGEERESIWGHILERME